MKTLVITAACLLVLLASSVASGQPVQVSTLALSVDTLNASGGMVIGPDGLLYVSNLFSEDYDFDRFNHSFILNQSDFGSEIYTVNTADGSVELFTEDLNAPYAMAFDHSGNLLVNNVGFGTVDEISPEGAVSGFGTPGGALAGIAVAADSSVLIAKCVGPPSGIVRFRPNSSIFDVFIDMGIVDCPLGLTLDDEGNLYVSFFDGGIRKYGPDGSDLGVVASPAQLFSPTTNITYSAADSSLYVTAVLDHRVWKVTLDGQRSVLAGSGFPGTADGVGTSASFTNPNGIAVSVTGDTLYVNQTLSEGVGNPNSIRVITGVLNADTSPVANEDEAEVPDGFLLAQNYPNPFNPATSIRFTLSQPQEVALTVYDVYGRVVATLLDGFRPAGAYEVVFDARALASGSYVYRLQAGRVVETKIMTFLK